MKKKKMKMKIFDFWTKIPVQPIFTHQIPSSLLIVWEQLYEIGCSARSPCLKQCFGKNGRNGIQITQKKHLAFFYSPIYHILGHFRLFFHINSLYGIKTPFSSCSNTKMIATIGKSLKNHSRKWYGLLCFDAWFPRY